MSGNFAFVETLRGIAQARACRAPFIGTDNPLLAHDPRAGGDVSDLSRHLPQAESTRLGRAATDILLALDLVLEKHDVPGRYGGLRAPLLLTVPMRALLNTLIQRGLIMQRALAEASADSLSIFAADMPRWRASAPWNIPRFAPPHRQLAEAGFLDNLPVEFIPVPFEEPASFNDTSSDDFWQRVFVVPPAVALFELAKRVRLLRFDGDGRIAVGKPSEAISETLPWLALRGLNLRKFQVPPYAGPPAPAFTAVVEPDHWLEDAARPTLIGGVSALGVFSERSTCAIVSIVLQHLAALLEGIGPTMQALGEALDRAFAGSAKPRLLLVSAIFGPSGAQLHALCRERGIVLIDFEHGSSTGLCHSSDRRIQVSEATICDVLMSASDSSSASFRRAPARRLTIHTIGLADQARKMIWQPLQRARARRRLRLNGGDATVMHVSGLLYGGNMRAGDDSPTDHYVFTTEKKLLCEIYGAVRRPVLFKSYPSQRFPHDARYDELFPLPPNVRLIDRADFRYVRAAADIIVTDASQSTLGWCMGAGVPLVRLCSRVTLDLASEELNALVAEAFFTVDLDRPGWEGDLIDLLNRDVADLNREWAVKSEKRKQFLHGAVFGPPGSVGRRAAKFVAGLHG